MTVTSTLRSFPLPAIMLLMALSVFVTSVVAKPVAQPPMEQYLQSVLEHCDRIEKQIPELTKLAEIVAERHANGGTLGVVWEPPSSTGPQGPQYEIKGRSVGMMTFDSVLKKELPDASREQDVAIVGWRHAPEPEELEVLKRYHEKYFVIAFGPRHLPELSEYVQLTDAWIDTGAGHDDRAVTLPNGERVGRTNALLNVLNSWAFLGEVIAALTRRGKMPTMLMSHTRDDSQEWNERYRKKHLFHDKLKVPPIPAGTLSRRYLERVRVLARQLGTTQQAAVSTAADLIARELAQGCKTWVAQIGHTTYKSIGAYEDRIWAIPAKLEGSPRSIATWEKETPDEAIVLRVGYSGVYRGITAVIRQKKQRMILIASGDDPRPDFQVPPDLPAFIDVGWEYGDAAVVIEGYPIRIFPLSGVMQLIAYEAVNVEVQSRLSSRKKP